MYSNPTSIQALSAVIDDNKPQSFHQHPCANPTPFCNAQYPAQSICKYPNPNSFSIFPKQYPYTNTPSICLYGRRQSPSISFTTDSSVSTKQHPYPHTTSIYANEQRPLVSFGFIRDTSYHLTQTCLLQNINWLSQPRTFGYCLVVR